MSANYAQLTIDQVKEGAAIPSLSYEVTATTVVLGSAGQSRLQAHAPRPRFCPNP